MPDSWHQVVDAAVGTHKASGLLRRAHKDSDDNRGGKYRPPKATALPQDPRPTPNNHMSSSTTGFNERASNAHLLQYGQPATVSQHQGQQLYQGQQNYHQPGTYPADHRINGASNPYTAYDQSSQYPPYNSGYPPQPPGPFVSPQRMTSFPENYMHGQEQYPPPGRADTAPPGSTFSAPQPPQRMTSFPENYMHGQEQYPPPGRADTAPPGSAFSAPQPPQCPRCHVSYYYGEKQCYC